MALPQVKSALRNAALGVAATAGVLAAPAASPAFAEEARSQTVAYNTQDAASRATAYSKGRNQVGIVIYFGSGNGVSADVIGDKFTEEFAKRGVTAEYFVAESSHPGVAMDFTIQEVVEGPYSPREAAANLNRIVAMRGSFDNMLQRASLDLN